MNASRNPRNVTQGAPPSIPEVGRLPACLVHLSNNNKIIIDIEQSWNNVHIIHLRQGTSISLKVAVLSIISFLILEREKNRKELLITSQYYTSKILITYIEYYKTGAICDEIGRGTREPDTSVASQPAPRVVPVQSCLVLGPSTCNNINNNLSNIHRLTSMYL
ncbi:unnamed protein product [Amoebophrya sp. A25]|nr:unnamed protein product [Amoebophrya sp. A25]|eukprot:GSA25T00022371001.1